MVIGSLVPLNGNSFPNKTKAVPFLTILFVFYPFHGSIFVILHFQGPGSYPEDTGRVPDRSLRVTKQVDEAR